MRKIGILALCLLLTACQNTKNPNANSSICRELRAKIVFNGSAVDPNQKFQQNADQPKLEESYHNEDCV